MGIKLLVVDDDADMLDVIRQALMPYGHLIDSTDDIDEALTLMAENEYDILITDKNLPGSKYRHEGGMELLQQVRRRHPTTEVIMITGYATLDTAIEAIKLGAFDYLSKTLSYRGSHRKGRANYRFKAVFKSKQYIGKF